MKPTLLRPYTFPCFLATNTLNLASNHSVETLHKEFELGAHKLFDKMPQLDVREATAFIGQLARQHQHKNVIGAFKRMLLLNIRPSEYTFGTVIRSCTLLRDLLIGRQLHSCALKTGCYSIVFVGSAIMDLYAKLDCIQEAKRAFDDIRNPNVVSYTTLIHGYLKKGTFDDAFKLFHRMPERNVVSWNAIIGGCSQMGENEMAVNLFVEMVREGFVPSQFTFPCAVSAAANVASLGLGKSLHACAVKFLGKIDVFVGNSLISFYAKCGSMEDSLLVFDKLHEKSIVSWNAVVCGFAQNGRGEDAIEFFERMQDSGLRPNDVTVLGLLWACNHAGLVDKGYSSFNQTRAENPELLKPEHYACMVDLLSRHGHFEEAQQFVSDLPFDPGIGFWKALLGGCLIHSNAELGQLAAEKISALDPEDVSSYVMLSNAHSAAGRWQIVSSIRREMKEKGMKRTPGCSWIEIRNLVVVFVNGDVNHPQKEEIYSALQFCMENISEDEHFDLLTETSFI